MRSPPLYEAVKARISDAIFTGQWPPGTVLPNEVDLADRFGVAVGTLRRAMLDLTHEGLLTRRRKTGTVVTDRSPQISLRLLLRYFRLHGLDGGLQTAGSEPLSAEAAPATPEEAAALNLAPGDEVIRIRRVRTVAGRPVMLDRFSLPRARFADLPAETHRLPDLLYSHLVEQSGLRISRVREALSAQAAAPEVAAALGLPPGAPVLVIDEVVHDHADAPVICARHWADTARHRYINELR
ncbi:GntR family transcriptional regulator [Paracoccus sp. S-4012]|uniref:GntR family transcriptional regulator n=1 Tax=Paracoccus sp. S-4012 TaxID=2665648 RepID=UPI001E59CBEC|nr:GntR family transcriptional regulator [Paracoccus sp. S-4012]